MTKNLPEKDVWQTTFTGKRFYPFRTIDQNSICLMDIAHGLSNTCRWGGQCSVFYSVAEHSARGSAQTTDPALAWEFLFHDASEAYIGDPIRPLLHFLPALEDIHFSIQSAINERFHVTDYTTKGGGGMSQACKEIDDHMMRMEAERLFSHDDHWYKEPGVTRPNYDIFVAKTKENEGITKAREWKHYNHVSGWGWNPSKAKRLFLRRAYELAAILHFDIQSVYV